MSLGKNKILSQGSTALAPPSGYFTPVTYTGTGNVQSISSLTFSPDVVWIKKRSSATSSDHTIQDTIRGIGSLGGAKIAYPTYQLAESTNADAGYFRSFDARGFTMGGNTYYNGLNEDYVAWCFRGGGSSHTFNVDDVGYSTAAAAGLNTGSVTVTAASVNTAAGFSMIQHNSTSGWETVPHGLNSTPEFIMSWSRTSSDGIYCFHTNFYTGGSIGGIKMFNYDGYGGSSWWRAMNSTTFETGLYNGGQNMISYVFHSVAGLQKVGSYTANNSVQNINNLGFDPSFVIIKNQTGSAAWRFFDSARGDYKALYNNNGGDDTNTGYLSFISGGFRLNGADSNYGSNTFVYIAIK